MKGLAGGAVTELGVQWLVPTQLILDPATVTAALIDDFEVGIVFVHLVGRAIFPIIKTHLAWSARERSCLWS